MQPRCWLLISASGAAPLLERGANLRTGENAYYFNNNIRDPLIKLGAFSQTRIQLSSQTRYYYSIYGRNKNAAHSITYRWGTFFTLSNPPLRQPATLTSTANSCAVKLSWDNANFPKAGATKAGYIILYSTQNIAFNQNANGRAPSYLTTTSTTRITKLQSSLPVLPPTEITLNGLSNDTLYYFAMVPYTYNGKDDSTYNYLTNGALTTTKKPLNCTFNAAAGDGSAVVVPSTSISITPNPSKYHFTLKISEAFANERIRITVSDATGRLYYNTQIKRTS